MAGKGSGRRPKQITDQEEADNWDRIFGKPDEPEELEQDELNKFDIDLEEDDNGLTDWRYQNGRA